jgi:hypothetical protein
MTVPATAVVLILISTTLLAWVSLFKWVPACMRSLYRHALWQLRDNLVDDVLSGRLPYESGVRSQLRLIEAGITHAHECTVGRILITYWWMLRAKASVDVASLRVDVEGLTEEQALHLRSYEDRFRSCTFRYLFLNSPAGWFAFLWVPPAFVLYRLFRRVRPVMRTLDRIVERPTLTVVESRWLPTAQDEERSRRDLAACVG